MTDVTVTSFIVYYTLLVYLGLDENIRESHLEQDQFFFYCKYFFVIHFGTSLYVDHFSKGLYRVRP